MKERWINAGFEDNELKPFLEPEADISDQKRIDVIVGMGFCKEKIQESLSKMNYDEITAIYLLLGRKTNEEVSESSSNTNLSVAKNKPTCEMNGQSPSHPKVQRSVSSSESRKSKRHNEQVGVVANSALSNSKKTVPVTADGDSKQEGGVAGRKPSTHSPPSPLLGNANNPNKTEIPDRKRGNSITPNCDLPPLSRPVPPHSQHSTLHTPDKTRFPTRPASRSTFHGQLRDRRTATYNGPPASPTQPRSRGNANNLLTKLTSKLTRRNMSFRFSKRVTLDPSKRQSAVKSGPAAPSVPPTLTVPSNPAAKTLIAMYLGISKKMKGKMEKTGNPALSVSPGV
ncbi:hypothetical protein cypCar_00025325 [Cyprinus carpio]|nr:hypothetical protein cypCar_00025325 [Cyprinus carpio]